MSTEKLQRINDHARRTLELLLHQFGSLTGTTVGRSTAILEASLPDGPDLLAVDTGDGPEDLAVEWAGRKSNWERLIDALVASMQEIEDEAWKLHTLRWIQTSQGAQLDGVGDLYGVPRGGLDDEEYRERILVATFRNRSSGTRDQLMEILAALTGTTTAEIAARAVYPAAVEMETNGQVIPPNLGSYMQSFAGAGIDLWVHLLPPDPEDSPALRVTDIPDEEMLELGSGDLLEIDAGDGPEELLLSPSEIPPSPGPGYGTFCDVDGDNEPILNSGTARITDVLYDLGD